MVFARAMTSSMERTSLHGTVGCIVAGYFGSATAALLACPAWLT